MKKRKLVALLASFFLILSLSACGNSANDVEPTPSDAAQQPTQTTEPSTEPTQEPTAEPSTEPTPEPAQEPTTAQTEEPGEQVPTSEESTPEATQEPTTPLAITAPSAPVHTHSYNNSVTKQATCDANGIITYTCSCGDSYTEAIKATGHNYSSTVVTEATCVEVGGRLYTCANCGNVYTETIPANGHNYVTQTIEHTEERLIGTETVNDYAQVTLYGCNACDFTTYDSDEMIRHVDARYAPTTSKCWCSTWWWKTTTEVVGTHEEPKYATRTTSELVHVCSICGHQE